MKFLIFMLILLAVHGGYAQPASPSGGPAPPSEGDQPFVYDDHGKRDPLSPLVSAAGAVIAYDVDLTMNDLMLEGIMTDAQGSNMAIINGKIVKAKDNIGPYMIEAIANDHVELLKGTEQFTLKLRKGGM